MLWACIEPEESRDSALIAKPRQPPAAKLKQERRVGLPISGGSRMLFVIRTCKRLLGVSGAA